MKKHLLFCCLAIVAAACTGDEQLTQRESADEMTRRLSSDVPIEFGTVRAQLYTVTRSTVQPDQAINDIGIFCLAKAPLDPSVTLAAWQMPYDYVSNNDEEVSRLSLWVDNAVVSSDPIPDSGIFQTLNWKNGYYNGESNNPAISPFYPVKHTDPKKNFAYRFVIYHPHVPSSQITYKTNYLYADIDLDGTQDVFWAASEENSDERSFSASYFRDAEDAVRPWFTVKHLLARLNFYVKLDEGSTNPDGFRVDSIVITNAVAHVKVLLANKSNGANEGTLNSKTGRTQMYLHDTDGGSIRNRKNADGTYKYVITSEYQKIGDCIMIPPVTNSEMKVFVYLKDKDGNDFPRIAPLTLPASCVWEEAKEYHINISISDPIRMQARLQVNDYSHQEADDINLEYHPEY